MAHPDYIVAPEARGDLPLLEPVYPLTAGLSGKVLLKAARQALERVPELPEWQDAGLAEAARLAGFQRRRSTRLHRPQDAADVSPASRALAAARLRRAAGRPAGAGAGAAELQERSPAAASPATAASAPGSPMRCPSRSPTRSARR